MLHISPNDHVLTSPNPTRQFFTSTYRCIVLLAFIDQRRHVHLGVGGGGVNNPLDYVYRAIWECRLGGHREGDCFEMIRVMLCCLDIDKKINVITRIRGCLGTRCLISRV